MRLFFGFHALALAVLLGAATAFRYDAPLLLARGTSSRLDRSIIGSIDRSIRHSDGG
jgi:hypothetical protein